MASAIPLSRPKSSSLTKVRRFDLSYNLPGSNHTPQGLGLEVVASKQINALLKTLQNYESAPVTRAQAKATASASKAPTPPPLPPFTPTPLDSLYLDGMNADQIWEQLELKTKNVLEVLKAIVTPDPPAGDGDSDTSGSASEEGDSALDDDDEDGMDLDMDAIEEYGDSEEDDEDVDEDAFKLRESGLEPDDDGDEAFEPGEEEESVAPLRPAHDDELIPDLNLDRPGGSKSASSSRRCALPSYSAYRHHYLISVHIPLFSDPPTRRSTTAFSLSTILIARPKPWNQNPDQAVG